MELLKSFLLPSSLVLLALVLGLLFLARWRTRTLGCVMLVLGALLYAGFGNGPVANALVNGLERSHRAATAEGGNEPADYIVVLAPHDRDARAMSADLVEAMRLHRVLPRAEFVLSGWEEAPRQMRDALLAMGVPAAQTKLETGSWSLHDCTIHLREPLKGERFLLVGPAAQMPRTLALFKQQQLDAIPVPTDFRGRDYIGPVSWLPTPGQLAISDLAVRERLDSAL